jgi:hypothetical protein
VAVADRFLGVITASWADGHPERCHEQHTSA